MTGAKPLLGQINRASPFAAGLVGAWLCGEGAGTRLADWSDNRMPGTLTAGETWGVMPGIGRCLIGATANGVNCGDSSRWSAPPATCLVWLMKTANPGVTGHRRVVSIGDSGLSFKGPGLGLYESTGGQARVAGGNNSLSNEITWALNTPAFAAIVYDAAGVPTFFWNGQPVAATSSGVCSSGHNRLVIGAGRTYDYEDAWPGYIATVLQYDRALSAGEVRALYEDAWRVFSPDRFRTLSPGSPPAPPPSTGYRFTAAALALAGGLTPQALRDAMLRGPTGGISADENSIDDKLDDLVGGGGSLTQQQVVDALSLAPTSDAPASGSPAKRLKEVHARLAQTGTWGMNDGVLTVMDAAGSPLFTLTPNRPAEGETDHNLITYTREDAP